MYLHISLRRKFFLQENNECFCSQKTNEGLKFQNLGLDWFLFSILKNKEKKENRKNKLSSKVFFFLKKHR